MRVPARSGVVAVAATLACGGTVDGGAWVREPPPLWRVTRGPLQPTGAGWALVTVPKFRAVVPATDGNAAELRFVYAGASESVAPLASGQVRRQIGLKLRAEDGCNLLYAMWRIAPEGGLVVSLKRNPGQRTHAECGARGYRTLVAERGFQPPPLRPGPTVHALEALLSGRTLRVFADGVLAWEGDVGDETLAVDGPIGVRTDNVRALLALRARPGTSDGGDDPGGGDDGED